MTTTATEKKKITITLSDRAPITIVADDWPVVARADWHDGQVRCQANRERFIKVREHEDGRRIVYGCYTTNWQKERGAAAGYVLERPEPLGERTGLSDRDADTIRAIRRVAGVIGDAQLADEVIADLPAEELT